MLSQIGHTVVNYAFKTKTQNFTIDNVEIIITKKAGYAKNYLNIYRLIKKVRPDVVISNFSYANPALLCGKILGVDQNIVWFHSLDKQMESTKLNITIKKKFLRLADLLIANSHLTKEELNKIYAVPKHNIKTLPFWSDIAKSKKLTHDLNISKAPHLINIGCPGRMALHKNQRIVIEALQKLKIEKRTNFHLYLAGVGDELENLKGFAQAADLKDHVTFNGHVSAENMVEFYKSMDLIILPSLHEAFGLVFIEAIALGVPVLVSSRFGALTFIDSKTKNLDDIIFDPKSSDDLKVKLERYMDRNGISSEFFKSLYQENFNKAIIFEDFLKILK